jgi:hypothetical protein
MEGETVTFRSPASNIGGALFLLISAATMLIMPPGWADVASNQPGSAKAGLASDIQTYLTIIESVLKIIALCGAAAFFFWKLFAGWLIINLKLMVTLNRARKDADTDYLAICLTLDKGATDTVWLKDIVGRVRDGDKILKLEPALELSSELSWWTIDDHHIRWSTSPTARKSALSPGEALQIARIVEIPAGRPVTVEVAAFGLRPFWPRGFHWRASAVSLPLAVAGRLGVLPL